MCKKREQQVIDLVVKDRAQVAFEVKEFSTYGGLRLRSYLIPSNDLASSPNWSRSIPIYIGQHQVAEWASDTPLEPMPEPDTWGKPWEALSVPQRRYKAFQYMTESVIEKALRDYLKKETADIHGQVEEALRREKGYAQQMAAILDIIHGYIPHCFGEIWEVVRGSSKIYLVARREGEEAATQGEFAEARNTLLLGDGFVGWTAQHRTICNVPNVKDPTCFPPEANYKECCDKTNSEIVIPIFSAQNSGNVLLVNLEAEEVEGFDEADIQLLVSLSDIISRVLIERQSHKENGYKEAEKRLTTLLNTPKSDIPTLSRILAEHLPAILPEAKYVEVVLYDKPDAIFEQGALWLSGNSHNNLENGQGEWRSYLFPDERYVALELSPAREVLERKEPMRLQLDGDNFPASSLFIVPVPHPNMPEAVLGCIAVYSSDEYAFAGSNRETLQRLAGHFADAVMRRQVERMQIAFNFLNEVDVSKNLNAVAQRACAAIHGKGCSIFRKVGEELVLVGTTGIVGSPQNSTVRYRMGEGMTGGVAEKGHTFRAHKKASLNGSSEITMLHKYNENIGDNGVSCEHYGWIGVPVKYGGKVLGIIRIYAKEKGAPFTFFDQEALEAFAERLGVLWNKNPEQERRLDSLIDLTKLFSATPQDKDYTLRQAVRLVMSAVNADVGMILFKESQQDLLRFSIYEVRGGDKTWEARAGSQTRPTNANSHVGRVFVNQSFAYIPDMRVPGVIAKPIHNRSIASITVPLTGPVTQFGVLACDSFTEDGFTQADVEAFQGFGRLIGVLLELEQAEKEKEAALAELTHQLVSHLSALRSNCLRLNRNMPIERIDAVRETLNATCELMSMTIFNVRNLKSLLNNSELTVAPTRELLFPFLKRGASLFQYLAKDKRIEIRVEESIQEDGTNEIVHAYFEPEHFAHAYYNLVDNAVKYSATDSVITISVDNSDNHYCTICVSNRGVPIEADELKKVFEKGYRAVRARTTSITGTGLGLALARKIVLLHKGDIWATSDKRSDGTADIRFYIKIPKTVSADAPVVELLKKGANKR
ncbi:MAG: GAF domain-containing protein [Armatimonadetes bacterium]|nr:GAF domain-containing protein [Armatimonadota bacterium]